MNDAGKPELPEIRLWEAMIYRALDDLRHEKRRGAALQWVLSNEEYTGSFRWVCNALDLNSSAVRRAVVSRLLFLRRSLFCGTVTNVLAERLRTPVHYLSSFWIRDLFFVAIGSFVEAHDAAHPSLNFMIETWLGAKFCKPLLL